MKMNRREGAELTGKTHVAAGMLIGGVVALYKLNFDPFSMETAICIVGGAIGGLLPDIDHPRSRIANCNVATKAAAVATRAVAGHRGIVHTPFFLLCAALICQTIYMRYEMQEPVVALVGGVLCGYATHIILDSFNKAGIMWLYPFSSSRFHLATVPTGGVIDRLLGILFLVIGACIVLGRLFF